MPTTDSLYYVRGLPEHVFIPRRLEKVRAYTREWRSRQATDRLQRTAVKDHEAEQAALRAKEERQYRAERQRQRDDQLWRERACREEDSADRLQDAELEKHLALQQHVDDVRQASAPPPMTPRREQLLQTLQALEEQTVKAQHTGALLRQMAVKEEQLQVAKEEVAQLVDQRTPLSPSAAPPKVYHYDSTVEPLTTVTVVDDDEEGGAGPAGAPNTAVGDIVAAMSSCSLHTMTCPPLSPTSSRDCSLAAGWRERLQQVVSQRDVCTTMEAHQVDARLRQAGAEEAVVTYVTTGLAVES